MTGISSSTGPQVPSDPSQQVSDEMLAYLNVTGGQDSAQQTETDAVKTDKAESAKKAKQTQKTDTVSSAKNKTPGAQDKPSDIKGNVGNLTNRLNPGKPSLAVNNFASNNSGKTGGLSFENNEIVFTPASIADQTALANNILTSSGSSTQLTSQGISAQAYSNLTGGDNSQDIMSELTDDSTPDLQPAPASSSTASNTSSATSKWMSAGSLAAALMEIQLQTAQTVQMAKSDSIGFQMNQQFALLDMSKAVLNTSIDIAVQNKKSAVTQAWGAFIGSAINLGFSLGGAGAVMGGGMKPIGGQAINAAGESGKSGWQLKSGIKSANEKEKADIEQALVTNIQSAMQAMQSAVQSTAQSFDEYSKLLMDVFRIVTESVDNMTKKSQ